MNDKNLVAPTKDNVKWAVNQEFEFLPDVDPAFSVGQLGFFRKLLLKFVVLPRTYLYSLKGQILMVGKQKIGYIFTNPKSVSLNVDSLGVSQTYRRQGVGKKLIEWAENFAKEKELTYLSASVTPENSPAIEFFSKLGFESFQKNTLLNTDISKTNNSLGKSSIEEISPSNLITEFEKWFEIALFQGDNSVKQMILEDYPRLGFKANARHWKCLDGENEIGYLRIAGLVGKLDIYLILDQQYWKSNVSIHVLRQALNTYPSTPTEIKLALGSTLQFEESKSIFVQSGFEIEKKPRYLMITSLDK